MPETVSTPSTVSPRFTPGPWRADWDDNGRWYIEPLGVTGTGLRGDSTDCLESANAHLIAAAPELLSDVKDIAAYFRRLLESLHYKAVSDRSGHHPSGYSYAEAFDWELRQKLEGLDADIAKAEGRS